MTQDSCLIPLSLYIHWPFCLKKCPYCDFNSHVVNEIDQEQWLDAFRRDMRSYAKQTGGRPLKTIFFGGGTPSLMEPFVVEGIIEEARTIWKFDNDIEISLEANPTSSEAENFKDYRLAGVNRLSIGVQSLNDDDLSFLGREHSADEARKTIELAKTLYDNVSFDLIYARPDQDLKSWGQELEQALLLDPEHISLYQLTIEQGTQFFTQYQRGDFQIPDDDLSSDLYEFTIDQLAQKGFEHYEISNFAKLGRQARHNLVYWQYDDYLGIGPGAHGRYRIGDDKRYATVAHKKPEAWLSLVDMQGHGLKTRDVIADIDAFKEMLMMGARLKQGVAFDDFACKTGILFRDVIKKETLFPLVENNDLEMSDDFFRLSKQGRMRLNLILEYLFGALQHIEK